MDESLRRTEWMKETEYEPRLIVSVMEGGFGFDAARIMATIEKPDGDVDRIEWGNWMIRVGAKASGNEAIGERTDVVGLGLHKGIRSIVFAFEVYPDLCEIPIENLRPIQIVEAIVERFGFIVTIGGKTGKSGKFFLMENIPRPPRGRRGQPFRDWLDVKHPNDERPFELRVAAEDDRLIKIALLFSISHREYGRWVMNR
jgi:hypothetical protein